MLEKLLTQAEAGTSGGFSETPSSRLRKTGEGYLGFKDSSISEIVGQLINGLLGLLGVIFLVLMIYAGYLWLTSQGDKTKVEKARDIIKDSIIGLIVVLAAYAITKLVLTVVLGAT